LRKVETTESGKGSENMGGVLFRGRGRKPYRFLRAANRRACIGACGCLGALAQNIAAHQANRTPGFDVKRSL
jgi:hypothetical protein